MEYLFLTVSAFVSLMVNGGGLFRRKTVERILVFKLDHLGDIVTATPAMAYLRRAYPGAEITMVVGSWVAEILADHPAADRFIVYESPRFDRGDRGSGKARLRAVLPASRYDLVIGLRDDWASLLVSLRVGAFRRRDRGTVRLKRKFNRVFGVCGGRTGSLSLHEVETNLMVAGGDPARDTELPSLPVKGPDRDWVSRELVAGRLNGREYVVLHPGAYSPLRFWPAERFARVARWILGTRRYEVVITGSAAEGRLAAEIAGQAGKGVHSLAGETSLSRAVAVIAGARAMVSLDTGVMHVATAVGTPVVALIGPEDPSRFGPFGPDHAVLYHRLPCSPCDQVNCVRPSPECMESITVEEVIEALAGILAIPARLGKGVDRR